MRLSFLLLALVAAATAVPKLHDKAVDVNVLKMQQDVLLLLQQVFQEIPNEPLRKLGYEYKIEDNLDMYRDVNVVKYLIRSVELGRIQRKGVPFTNSITDLRKEVMVLTRTFLCAKDYMTFLKTAAWARCIFNEAQFVKAFCLAVLQRPETRDVVVLPALYEVFPETYFDTRVIKEAQLLRSGFFKKTDKTKSFVDIPVRWHAWLPKGEDSLAYFTQDIGLSTYYAYFNLGGWMVWMDNEGKDDTTLNKCEGVRCEISRGAQYYYIHQQLLARYEMERLTNKLGPIMNIGEFSHIQVPFKSRLSFFNGLEFPGRDFNENLMPEKDKLIRTVLRLERRLRDAIDSGFAISAQGSILALYKHDGMNILGNLIESTGRSVNPRFYGCLQGALRKLLGGGSSTGKFWEPIPSALEVSHTAVRDPMFYRMYRRILDLFKDYQDSLPFYKQNDIIVPGVKIETVKFDKLVTYCDEFKADIDAATVIPMDKGTDFVRIKAVVERLNHKPYNYEIVVESKEELKKAVVRVYIGPKFDHWGRKIMIEKNRLLFVELDQFFWDIKVGKTVIVRNNNQAPMRMGDIDTKKDILRKVEDALNSHQPFYSTKTTQINGFPERLALPKGRRDGFPIQVVVIVSANKPKTLTYDAIVPKAWNNYNRFDFEGIIGDYTIRTHGGMSHKLDYSKQNTGYGYEREYRRGSYEDSSETRHRYHGGSHEDTFETRRADMGRFGKTEGRFDEGSSEMSGKGSDVDRDTKVTGNRHMTTDYLTEYYKDKHITEIIGGAVSLDGRPLGYPFNRPMTSDFFYVPNVKVIDEMIFHEGRDCRFYKH